MARSSTLAVSVIVVCGLSTVPAGATAAEPVRIHDIQGVSRTSPLDEQRVAAVPGVVTAVRDFGSARGFWFQDPHADGDPRTSEGLFVFTGRQTPPVAPGDAVAVTATVAEHFPLAEGETPETTGNQSITQLTDADWRVTGRQPVPAAERLRPGTVPDLYARDAGGDETDEDVLHPWGFALDFYESREGMSLTVEDARVVGATDDYDGLWLTSKPRENRTERGGTAYTSYREANSGRLKVDSLLPPEQHPFPLADVGDELRGLTEGPLDYDRFGGYVLRATALGEHVPGNLQRESTRPQREDELAIATYNVENLAATDDPATIERLAQGVTRNLAAPDIVALEEVQDDNGAVDDGTVTADGTLRTFVDAIAAAGGPRYQWRQIDPVDGADGGEPGGNIRVAFLFNPARVSAVDVPGGDASTAVEPVESGRSVTLNHSPGRIDPRDPAWQDSRKPLVQEFSFRGEPVFVVANHFASKGGDQPLHGRFQYPDRVSEEQRVEQAKAVRGFVDDVLDIDRRARVVVAGDLNDFGFSPTVRELTRRGGLVNAADSLPDSERYSYVYDGNSQALDHILHSRAVRDADYDIVHANAEFADQASDHDPQVIRIR